MTFSIRPLDASTLREVRTSGRGCFGMPVEHVVADGGEPLRCCLRDASPGEELILFGYEPVLPAPSPYREIGAVFAHARACGPAGSGYPRDWLGRPQVLRAYDARGWIHPATTTHDGTDAVGVLERVLAAPGVVEVHSRNIAYGCYMFAAVPGPVTSDDQSA